MRQIWQSVKVKTTEHPRFGQAGTVQAVNPEHTDEVGVKFDNDGTLEVTAVADLEAL